MNEINDLPEINVWELVSTNKNPSDLTQLPKEWLNFDGAPEGYWQVYEFDMPDPTTGQYHFPIEFGGIKDKRIEPKKLPLPDVRSIAWKKHLSHYLQFLVWYLCLSYWYLPFFSLVVIWYFWFVYKTITIFYPEVIDSVKSLFSGGSKEMINESVSNFN